MLSRRDKLLVQPWEERKFKDHRCKVQSALPAIDDRAPPARPHVAAKLKKTQRENDRKAKILSDNFSLLQRLNAIMKVNRLDNHWTKPLPNFHHKVGVYFDARVLRRRLSRDDDDDDDDDYDDHDSCAHVRCYACARRKTSQLHLYPTAGRAESLPSIYSNGQ